MNWLSSGNTVRRRYFQYILSAGIYSGWTSIAKPRSGISITTPATSSSVWWSLNPRIWFHWLRFRYAVPREKWAILRQISIEVERHVTPDGVLLWYFGILDRYRGSYSLARRLIHCSLPERNLEGQRQPIYLHTARPLLGTLLSKMNAEVLSKTDLSRRTPPLTLYRIERGKLRNAAL